MSYIDCTDGDGYGDFDPDDAEGYVGSWETPKPKDHWLNAALLAETRHAEIEKWRRNRPAVARVSLITRGVLAGMWDVRLPGTAHAHDHFARHAQAVAVAHQMARLAAAKRGIYSLETS